jgi:hypothetical protein
VKLNLPTPLKRLAADFRRVADIAGLPVDEAGLLLECLPAPHRRPAQLPIGKRAVYVFLLGSTCLKVGKAGAKSRARFTSQHYEPNSCRSNLAKSLLRDGALLRQCMPDSRRAELASETTIGAWIESHATRWHLFLEEHQSPFLWSLLEAFVHCRLRPRFEGRYDVA